MVRLFVKTTQENLIKNVLLCTLFAYLVFKAVLDAKGDFQNAFMYFLLSATVSFRIIEYLQTGKILSGIFNPWIGLEEGGRDAKIEFFIYVAAFFGLLFSLVFKYNILGRP